MSQLLWNLVVDDLVDDLEGQDCKVVEYGNDLLILVVSQKLGTLMKFTQLNIEIIVFTRHYE